MISQRSRVIKSYKKHIGVTLCILSVFFFVALFLSVFSGNIAWFFKGTFGALAYITFPVLFLFGLLLISGKKYRFNVRANIYKGIVLFAFFCILQLAITNTDMGASAYADIMFSKVSPMGLALGIIPYGISRLIFDAGAYVFFVLLAVIFIALFVDYRYGKRQFVRLTKNRSKRYTDASTGQTLENGNLANQTQNPTKTESVYITLNKEQNRTANEAKAYFDRLKQDDQISNSNMQNQSTVESALERLGLKTKQKEQPQAPVIDDTSLKLKSFITTPQAILAPPVILNQESNQTQINDMEHKRAQAEQDFLDAIKPRKRLHTEAAEATLKQNYQQPRIIGDDSINTNSNIFVEPERTTQPQQPKQTAKQEVEQIEKRINKIINGDDFVEKPQQPVQIEPIKQVEQVETTEEATQKSRVSNRVFAPLSYEPLAPAIEDLLGIKPEAADEEISKPSQETINELEQEASNIQTIRDGLEAKPDSNSALVNDFKKKFPTQIAKPIQESLFTDEQNKKKEPPKFWINPNSPYNRPPIELLQLIKQENEEDQSEAIFERVEKLENALASFNVPAKVRDMIKGPTVTRYELEMPVGKTVKLIQTFASDIAMNLAVKGRIRVEAPIPGKSAVGIEVPNDKISMIGLREIIQSSAFQKGSPLTFALGKDVTGSQIMVCDLLDMPHLLIAGSTGSGKSVCLNVLICSLIYRMSPEDLRIILIDPKRVEFTSYIGLPHLILPEPITEVKDSINALAWVVGEIDRRYTVFQATGVNHILEYNNLQDVVSGKVPKLPAILIVIDELQSLIQVAKKEAEEHIRRITALARAAGIHLVVATQRPSADVITGTIKVNLPSRIAFQVTNWVDSKTILDQPGAEDLVGRGDMLYYPKSFSSPLRAQCAYISLDEVKAVVSYIKTNNEAYFDEELKKEMLKIAPPPSPDLHSGPTDLDSDGPELDREFYRALKLVVETGQATVSLLQRKFGFGFQRAAKIIDQMEQHKFISTASENRTKPRNVFLTMEELKDIFPEQET